MNCECRLACQEKREEKKLTKSSIRHWLAGSPSSLDQDHVSIHLICSINGNVQLHKDKQSRWHGGCGHD